jgi:hypothetical protein
VVGLWNIDEQSVRVETRGSPRPPPYRLASLKRGLTALWQWLRATPTHLTRNRTIFLLVLFISFWKFSPSIGYIERSYLIDVRHFNPAAFGVILSAGSVTFLASILVYRWMVRRFRYIRWYQYLYAMVAIAVLSFPLSFFLYLEPEHPWWEGIFFFLPDDLDLIAGWSRYEWFRLITETVLGFATIPAFIIPLTIAGETVRVENAGVGYAFLMSLANVTDMFEGAVGAGLYTVLALPAMDWLLAAFHTSTFDIAGVNDERTLILQIFVYISLLFTIFTLPLIEILRREFARRGIEVDLAGHGA